MYDKVAMTLNKKNENSRRTVSQSCLVKFLKNNLCIHILCMYFTWELDTMDSWALSTHMRHQHELCVVKRSSKGHLVVTAIWLMIC